MLVVLEIEINVENDEELRDHFDALEQLGYHADIVYEENLDDFEIEEN